MFNYNANILKLKEKIVNFSNNLTNFSNKPSKKFVMDMIYGIIASKSTLLSKISDALNEKTKKINTIDRLSMNLSKDMDVTIEEQYLKLAIENLPENPVILVDDSDVIKPTASKFEALGLVKDGSSKTNKIEKGYHVTEMVGLTINKNQPISLFSKIHSSSEKDYVSANSVTYEGIEKISSVFKNKATFIFDRGYDMNELFRFMYEKNQNFVIRLKENRKIFFKGKWYKATTLRDSRKGKIKTTVLFQGEKKECYISHLNVKITANKNNVNLVLVYGLGEVPMMLSTNLEIKSKEDVEKILRLYMSRWRIEEYFKFKKQEYDFENFRVRNLTAINNLNKMLTYAIGIIAILTDRVIHNTLSNKIIEVANPLKEKVIFEFYRFSSGIYNILSKAHNGIKSFQNIRKSKEKYMQLCFL